MVWRSFLSIALFILGVAGLPRYSELFPLPAGEALGQKLVQLTICLGLLYWGFMVWKGSSRSKAEKQTDKA